MKKANSSIVASPLDRTALTCQYIAKLASTFRNRTKLEVFEAESKFVGEVAPIATGGRTQRER